LTDLLDFSHVSQRAKSSISHYLTYGQHRGQSERYIQVFFNYPSLDQLTDHLLEDVLEFEEEEQDEDIDDLLESINKLTE